MDSTELRKILRKELLTIPEVQEILGLSWVTVSRMIGSKLEGINLGNSPNKANWRIRSSSVKRLLGIEDEVPA